MASSPAPDTVSDTASNTAGTESARVVRALGALAQEHRLAAYRQLVQAGPEGMAAGVLAQRLGLAASSLSFHLAQLVHADLIVARRQGRSIVYSADFTAMNALMGFLTENCCGGVSCAPVPACPPDSSCMPNSSCMKDRT
ncbi:ArsR/SmtB family transcription factor [Novosphingobium pituita]|uniref:ArsR/SmtB family transcription factor n=1 Tax=Novosphingobium pituita TaxID=3056842 RepID=UPI00295EA7AB|nr:metalloregulator ArsR/SmtB family transcription factor [Novosphingobium sp. IK01]